MHYIYTALDQMKKRVTGEIEAESAKAAASVLRDQKLLPISIEDSGKKRTINIDVKNIFRRVTLIEKIVFIKNLSVMLKAGFPISRALSTLAQQATNRTWKNILLDIANQVEGGQTLATAMEKYPNVFSPVFVNIVHVGEVSGNMEESLADLATQLQKDHDLVRKARGAMIYPSIVLTAMVIIAVLMFTFVLPKLTNLFAEFNVQLPLLTRMLMATADFMKVYGIFVLIGIAALIAGLFLANRNQEFIKSRDKIFLKVPTFGKMIKDTNIARMCRTLASLLKSGMSILETVKITGESLGNYEYRQALKSVEKDVRGGESLSQSLRRYSFLFPPLVINMLSVGEESGNIDTVLTELSEFYEGEVNQKVSNLSSILEPVLMLIVGVSVGVIALGLVMPIYSISQGI